eukprot:Sdes_comp18285_c0_seq4m7961
MDSEDNEDSGIPNRNAVWFKLRGIWVYYIALILGFHIFVNAIPSITTGGAWCITIVFHNVVTMVVLHFIKGTPFDEDQGKYKLLTAWEQIDEGEQNTFTRKFYTIVPIILYVE